MPGLFNVAVDALIVDGGKVLICKRADDRDHAPGQWEALGGRVEQGETLEQAARREAKEETGLEVEVVEPIYTFRFLRGAEKAEHLGVSFWCKYRGGEVKIDPHEHSQFLWATPDEALELISDESIKRAISKLEEKLVK
ncbi:MAG: NUDIX domain-containing protein [Patescibacteria group bacterium]|nr:NUDIX domain-containing protein [Patescibacteria group bacterium]